MAKSVMALDNAMKQAFYDRIETLFAAEFDCLRVPLKGASESRGYRLAVPTVDEEGNEKTILIELSVPRGSRDGTPYDPYFEHEQYEENVAAQDAKQKAREEKEQREKEERERKRAARKSVKTIKKEIQEVLPSQTT